MSNVVGTDGKSIDDGAEKHRRGVEWALRNLLENIESGEIGVEQFYLIAQGDSRLLPNGGVSEPMMRGYDSGLTIEQAVMMLEREKFRILCAADGIVPR